MKVHELKAMLDNMPGEAVIQLEDGFHTSLDVEVVLVRHEEFNQKEKGFVFKQYILSIRGWKE